MYFLAFFSVGYGTGIIPVPWILYPPCPEPGLFPWLLFDAWATWPESGQFLKSYSARGRSHWSSLIPVPWATWPESELEFLNNLWGLGIGLSYWPALESIPGLHKRLKIRAQVSCLSPIIGIWLIPDPMVFLQSLLSWSLSSRTKK